MLHKQRSKKTAILKYGLFVPLFALTLILSSATIRKNNSLIAVAEQIPLNNIEAAVSETIEAPLKIVDVKIAPRRFDAYQTTRNSTKNKTSDRSNKDWETFYNYLGSNIKYPKEAMDNHIQGDVRINFNVETGKIQNLAVVGNLGHETEQEVKQSILAFNKDLPAEDGSYSFVTAFKLDQLTSKEEATVNEAPNGYNELPKIVVVGYAISPKKEDNTVYSHVALSNPPTYPGGIAKFYKWLGSTIKYPFMAAENNVQGTVYISFNIEKDGSLTDIKVDGRKLGYGLEDEAVRVVKLSKKWNPGMENNKPVRVKYNIPIKFAMPEIASTKKAVDQKTKSSSATEAISLKLRGHDKEPMLIVDGKNENYLSYKGLNPNTIESISILKDAQAIALYGKEAENGAILITTKKDASIKSTL